MSFWLDISLLTILEGKKVKFIKIYPLNDAKYFEIQYVYEVPEEQRELDQQKALAIDFGVNNLMTCVISEGGAFVLLHNIGNLVCGYNVTFQRNSRMGKRNNQNFVNIPFGEIRQKLEYLCELYGIKYHEQEESYTSKASFLDCDELPVYNADNPQKYIFSGKRTYRGLYQSKNGIKINADVNGALNILRKSNVVSLTGLYSRGGLATPLRIRVRRY